MPEYFKFDDPRWHFDDPIVRFDSFVPETVPTNMNTNKISAVFSAADQATAMGHITDIDALLTFLQGLTPEQKKQLDKAANKRIPFIQQAHMHAQQHPEVLPANLDLTEFGKDVTFISAFAPFVAAHDTQNEKAHDTLTLASSDALTTARRVYDAFKSANGNGEYDTIVANLGLFFKGQGPQTPPPPGP